MFLQLVFLKESVGAVVVVSGGAEVRDGIIPAIGKQVSEVEAFELVAPNAVGIGPLFGNRVGSNAADGETGLAEGGSDRESGRTGTDDKSVEH